MQTMSSNSSSGNGDQKIPSSSQTSCSSTSAEYADARMEQMVLDMIKSDAFVVEWYGPDDPINPQNLPLLRKWLVTMSIALYVLTTTFASSVFSAAAVATAVEFDVAVETMVRNFQRFAQGRLLIEIRFWRVLRCSCWVLPRVPSSSGTFLQ